MTSIVMLVCGCNDKCKKVECLNNGICVEGTCDCATGFEGTDCAALSRDKFIGTYQVLDTCVAGNTSFPAHVVAGSTASSLVLTFNLGLAADTLEATVSGNNVTVPLQHFFSGTLVTATGQFNNADSSFVLHYTTHDTAINFMDTCSSKWIRQ